VLDRKAEIDASIRAERERLTEQRQNIDQRISALKADYEAAKARTDGLVDGLIARLGPDRRQIDLDIQTARHTLKAREAEQRSLEHTLALLERSLSESGTETTPTGGATDDRKARLAQTRESLDGVVHDIEQLRLNLIVLKHKQRLLRQRR